MEGLLCEQYVKLYFFAFTIHVKLQYMSITRMFVAFFADKVIVGTCMEVKQQSIQVDCVSVLFEYCLHDVDM